MIVIALLAFSSCQKQDIIRVDEVDNLTPLRKSLGITGYKNINKEGRNIQFNLQAAASYVNGTSINFSDSKVFIENKPKVSQLTLTYPDKTIGQLVFNKETGSILYTVDGKIQYKKSLTTDSGQEIIKPDNSIPTEIEVIFLMTMLSDPYLSSDVTNQNITTIDFTQSNNTHTPSFKIAKREDEEGDACVGQEPYYGYTLGWGYTKTGSEDHEKNVRSDSDNIKKYGCRLIGTDTSCLFDNHYCVTTSTFACCTKQ